MVCVLLQQANFLLLDEPTNNLDIPSKEILLRALLNFDGTIFFVSHDHDFVNRLSSRIIELSPQGTTSYHGNYQDYLYQKQHMLSLSHTKQDTSPQAQTKPQEQVQEKTRTEQAAHGSRPTHPTASPQHSPQTPASAEKTSTLDGAKIFELRKQAKKLETTIDKLENEIVRLEKSFAQIQYGTPEFDNAQKRLQECKQKLASTLQEWESAQEKLA
jgi:ATP-binding cassette, subfamily F, member 3